MVLNKILLEMTITEHVVVTTEREAGEGRVMENAYGSNKHGGTMYTSMQKGVGTTVGDIEYRL